MVLERSDEMPGVLSHEEFESLPTRYAVALAARTAERLLPLVRAEWTHSRPEQIESVSHAVRTANAFIDQGSAIGDFRETWIGVAYAFDSCRDASERAQLAVRAAHDAIAAAHHLYASALGSCQCDETLSQHRLRAMEAAFSALHASTGACSATGTRIRADFEALAAVVDDDARLTSDLFGPMWPDGPPDDWPA